MGYKLTCGCLNIKIHTKRAELLPVDLAQIGIPDNTSEEFFTLKIAEAQLDLEGIRLEHGCLLRRSSAYNWILHRCVNCDMWTHAVHPTQGGKVLVNTSLKRDPTIIETLEKSPDFSPLYKIVLTTKNDNHPVQSLGLQSEKYESLQRTLASVQGQLIKFLRDEEAAMEDRIRSYEEEQRHLFAELQSKVRREKNAMISLILAEEERMGSESSQDDLPPITGRLGSSRMDNRHQDEAAMDEAPAQPRFAQMNSRSKEFIKKSKMANKLKTSQSYQVPRSSTSSIDSPDAEGLFDLEGLADDEDSRPFYNSDDETEDTDDSGAADDLRYYHGNQAPVKSIYSSSVPISVPNWRMENARFGGGGFNDLLPEVDDDDRVHGLDQATMAASIQAMAQSVHEDSALIFGDRPRPRLNTMDFGKI